MEFAAATRPKRSGSPVNGEMKSAVKTRAASSRIL